MYTPRLAVVPLSHLPVALALLVLLIGGGALLLKNDAQARDTIRKHHIEDIEQALYFARNLHGTYPPYDQPTWCGLLDEPANGAVKAQVEAVLRAQHAKYANPDKPFPQDPRRNVDPNNPGYFYWKRSPAVFELYTRLEADQNGERSTINCATAPPTFYDYGINSALRQTN